MKKLAYLTSFMIFLFTACNQDDSVVPVDDVDNSIPVVQAESTYSVLKDSNVVYAEGLGYYSNSNVRSAIPQYLDVYYPDNDLDNRPVFMFIHGGGFKGGTKTKPEIVEMANYYASRGWIYVSVDYRTTEELSEIQGMTPEELVPFYEGIVPAEWVEHTLDSAMNVDQVQQSIAMYAAQRDAKAALRWIVANKDTYSVNTDYITVGGASAGAITTIALGISDLDDFRDEISIAEDPTLTTTNLEQSYSVRSMVYFWGSNIKLDVFGTLYDVYPYDSNDPELFMAHGNKADPVTPYSEALELQDIYESIGVHSELVTLDSFGHGAWNATVDGKGLYELSFDFLIDRQNLNIE